MKPKRHGRGRLEISNIALVRCDRSFDLSSGTDSTSSAVSHDFSTIAFPVDDVRLFRLKASIERTLDYAGLRIRSHDLGCDTALFGREFESAKPVVGVKTDTGHLRDV